MNRIYISIIISLIALSASSQQLWLGAEGQKFYDEFINRQAVKGEMESYEGSPYMNEEFTESSITSSENDVFEKVPLRYNIYNDVFEVEMEDAVYKLRRGGMVAEVSLPGHSFIYSKYDYLSSEGEGYLELLVRGNYTLYKKYRVIFKKAEPAQPYMDAKPAMFQERDPLFFIAQGDDQPVFIRNNRSLEDIAGKKGKALKDFIRDKRLKIRNEEDIVRVVQFLNNMY
ncbi:MAG: hypothetical protein KFF49_10890 [Bacteroidales bacterium]|nr:hypothetical protein [Bacteroidales bacterium]